MNPSPWPFLSILAQAEPVAAPFARSVHVYWFLIPLVIAISLVYSASRHESWSRIGWQSLRLSGAILGILLVTTIILLVINTQV